MTDLERLRGVGSKTATYLREAGYETAEEVLDAERDELLSINGIGYGTLEKLEIREERTLKSIRIPTKWREVLREAVEDTPFTLSDALRCVLPTDVEDNIMSIPEEEYVHIYVEEDVHAKVRTLAGKNITSLDVLEKYMGKTRSEDLRLLLDNEQSELYHYEEKHE